MLWNFVAQKSHCGAIAFRVRIHSAAASPHPPRSLAREILFGRVLSPAAHTYTQNSPFLSFSLSARAYPFARVNSSLRQKSKFVSFATTTFFVAVVNLFMRPRRRRRLTDLEKFTTHPRTACSCHLHCVLGKREQGTGQRARTVNIPIAKRGDNFELCCQGGRQIERWTRRREREFWNKTKLSSCPCNLCKRSWCQHSTQI